MKAKHIKKSDWNKIIWKIINNTFRIVTITAFAVLFVTALALTYTYGVGNPCKELWTICGVCIGWFAILGFLACLEKM